MIVLLQKVSNAVDWLITRLVFLLIIALIIVISLQIVSRIFFSAFSWTEELSRYLLVWSTFLGASMAYKRKSHIAVTFAADLLRGLAKTITRWIVNLLTVAFLAVAIYYSVKMISLQVFQVSPALGISMSHVYISLPLGFTAMFIHALSMMAEELFPGREVRS
ncbi:MAG: TRAP transporter small permease [Syntrophomonadaceae bacterium]|nr:TRAP transporter small permease [Syntrophomonadaceae bacterium]